MYIQCVYLYIECYLFDLLILFSFCISFFFIFVKILFLENSESKYREMKYKAMHVILTNIHT